MVTSNEEAKISNLGKPIILVQRGKGELYLFDTSKNITGYILVNLATQEFTFDFDPIHPETTAGIITLKRLSMEEQQ